MSIENLDRDSFPDGYDFEAKLHPDLVNYVKDGRVDHKFVIQTYTPELVHAINMAYEHNKGIVAEAEATNDYARWVFAHEKPYRLAALYELSGMSFIPDKEYWTILAELWENTECPFDYLDYWAALFYNDDQDDSKRHLMMNEEEQAVFGKLPDPIPIYRGCGKGYQNGWSWTLDRDRAIWFAERHTIKDGEALVLSATCPKEDAFAYLSNRKEDEIIADPTTVTIISEETITKGDKPNPRFSW